MCNHDWKDEGFAITVDRYFWKEEKNIKCRLVNQRCWECRNTRNIYIKLHNNDNIQRPS